MLRVVHYFSRFLSPFINDFNNFDVLLNAHAELQLSISIFFEFSCNFNVRIILLFNAKIICIFNLF